MRMSNKLEIEYMLLKTIETFMNIYELWFY